MINPALDISLLKYQFQQNRIVVIENFLLEEIAERWYNHFANLPADAWTISFWPKRDMELQNSLENRAYHRAILERCKRTASNGEYARFAGRITGLKYRDAILDEVVKFYASQEVFALFREITEIDVKETSPSYAYCYEPENFVTTHCDKGDGRLTYVQYLSREWEVEWGGLFIDRTNDPTTRVIVPDFNTLVLFDMTGQRLPHEVTPVAVGAPNRLSISSWYK